MPSFFDLLTNNLLLNLGCNDALYVGSSIMLRVLFSLLSPIWTVFGEQSAAWVHGAIIEQVAFTTLTVQKAPIRHQYS